MGLMARPDIDDIRERWEAGALVESDCDIFALLKYVADLEQSNKSYIKYAQQLIRRYPAAEYALFALIGAMIAGYVAGEDEEELKRDESAEPERLEWRVRNNNRFPFRDIDTREEGEDMIAEGSGASVGGWLECRVPAGEWKPAPEEKDQPC